MSKVNVVHESIDERQFVRAKINSKIIVKDDLSQIECLVEDISLGGVSFTSEKEWKKDQLLDIKLEFELKEATTQFRFKIKIVKSIDGKTNAMFVDMDEGKRKVIQYFITGFLGGEIVNTEGMLNVIQRDSYIKARKNKDVDNRTIKERIQISIVTLIFFLISLAVLCTILFKVYMFVFSTSSVNAFVDGNVYRLKMPENGYVKFLLPEGIKAVKKGDPIATVSTQLMSRLNTPSDFEALANISEADMQLIMGRTLVETVINSPCDCTIIYSDGLNERYAYKDEELMHLMPTTELMMIKASFLFRDIGKIHKNSQVNFTLFGEDTVQTGLIVKSFFDKESGNIFAFIKPDNVVEYESYTKPVLVKVMKSSNFVLININNFLRKINLL